MEQGWDPGVKIFFNKILWSFFWGLSWMIASVTAGIYFQLGFFSHTPIIWTILFYLLMLIALLLLIRYLYKVWK